MVERQAQLRVSPSEGERKIIKILASGWGMPEAAVIMLGFRRSMPDLMSEFEQAQRLQGNTPAHDPLRLLLLRLATGEAVPEHELTELAYDCNLPVEVLHQIRDCLEGKKRHASKR